MDNDEVDSIVRQASLYTITDNTGHIDNRLFEKDDVSSKEDMDHDV